MSNGNFKFLSELNMDLYKRYKTIEESLKNSNGSIYVEMQVYLETLFKFISRREGYNIHQSKTLGEFLNNSKIINYCLVRIEYDNLDLLKTINYYGNNYKHQALVEFRFNEFIKFIEETYIISLKVNNYYKKQNINQVKPLDINYYMNIIVEEKKREEKRLTYQNNIKALNKEVSEKYSQIRQLEIKLQVNNEELKELKKVNSNLSKENNYLNRCLIDLENKNFSLTEINNKLKKENKYYRIEIKELIKKIRHLSDYKEVSFAVFSKIIKKETGFENIIDSNIIKKIIQQRREI